MNKRILATLLALALALTLLPAPALAVSASGTCGDNLSWTLEDGVLTISGEGAMNSYYNTIQVPWYNYRETITTLVLQPGVTTIEDYAFYDCTGLTSVTIPNGVTSIGSYAFQNCPGLTSVTIPDSVTAIGESAFTRCTGLTSVTIPEGVTTIGDYSFYNCTGLTSVTIPDSVTSIESYMFYDCTGLTSVTIPDSVTTIDERAFEGCTGLTSVTIPNSVTTIDINAFAGCTGLTSVTIGDGVTIIGYSAFYGCTGLKTAKILSKTATFLIGAFSRSKSPDLTVYGYAGSTAQTFCQENNIPFALLENAPVISTAYASTQTVDVDGQAVTFECYALKDANGNATNYIKLRDLAMLLNGSAAQFQVGWDGSVTITTQAAYTPNGSEQKTPFSGNRAYEPSTAVTKINGRAADLAAFVLTDDAGGGYTYYQLRDLGKALGFNVGWAAGKGIFVETDKPYDIND